MRRRSFCFIFVFVWSVCYASASTNAADKFVADVQSYYVDANWVCRSFAQMRLAEFTCAWNFVVNFMTDESCSWRYFCDTKQAYQAFCAHTCNDVTEFAKQSVFAAWLEECRLYERFLLDHTLDTQYDVIVPLVRNAREFDPLVSKTPMMRLVGVLGTFGSDSLHIFYSFYFECAVNVFLRAIDFIDRTSAPSQPDAQLVQGYKKILDTVYQNFRGTCQQVDARTRRLMAFHYQRACSVWHKVCVDKHLDFFAQDAA